MGGWVDGWMGGRRNEWMGGLKEWVDGWMAEREVWVGGERGQGGSIG
jgi:hypothetical protein